MQWAAESGADVVSMSLGDSIPVRRHRPDVDGGGRAVRAVRHAVRHRGRQRRAGEHLRARVPPRGADRRRRRQAGQPGLLLQHRPAVRHRRDEAGPHRAGRGHQRRPLGSRSTTATARTSAISGTSMATPHVSGAAAILLQRTPTGPAQQLKDALMSSAKGLADWYTPYEVGTGRLDVAAARHATRCTPPVRCSSATSTGRTSRRTRRSTKTVTFTNYGTAAVTLNLASPATARSPSARPR